MNLHLAGWRWVLHRAGAALLLAVALGLWPGEAKGGCSHPWLANPIASTGGVDELELFRFPAPSAPRAPGPGKERSPCAGGRCSPAPAVPAGASPAPRFHRDPEGIPPGAPDREVAEGLRSIPPEPPLHPVFRFDPLDRPPRG